MACLSGTSEIRKKSRKFTKSRVPREPLGIACPNKYLHDQCHESYLCVKYEALMFRNAKNKIFKKKVKKRAQNGTNTRQTDRGAYGWVLGGSSFHLADLMRCKSWHISQEQARS